MSARAELRLPLIESGRIEGDVGFGRSAPSVGLSPAGVVVNQRGRVSLWSFDLRAIHWACSIPNWGTGPVVHEGRVLVGPTGGAIWALDLLSGGIDERLPHEGPGELMAVDAERLVVRGGGYLTTYDWHGAIAWKRKTLPTHVRLSAGVVLLTEGFDRVLLCLDARTGDVRWRFEAPPEAEGDAGRRSQVIPAGFPSVTVVGDRVIVLTISFRVFILSLVTGEIIAQAKPPFSGWYVVTDSSIFFKQAFGLSEFDHRELREVDRIEYQAEVEPLYGDRQVSVNAFCLSEESVIWTTMHGALMGVSRKPVQSERRVTWCHDLPGALMPLAEAPVVHGGYLYFTKKGEHPELLCFEGSAT